MGLAIGIDIGGTKVAAGVVDDEGHVLARGRRRTPSSDPDHIVDVCVEIVRQLRTDYDAGPVGVGAAGYIDASRSTVLFSPNLAWRNTPLREQISARLGGDVVVENDANVAAWGEFRFGAGEQQVDMVCITVGTGIGCGLILSGQLYRGHFGIAGEPGHMRAVPGGRLCGCGNYGCLEQYASGSALVRAAREVATERRDDAKRLLQLAGGDIEAIDGPSVTMAAQEGDPAAIDCFNEIGRWLGQGLADIAAMLDPGRFVIGGGVAEAGELLLKSARDSFNAQLTGRGYRPHADIVAASLGSDAGLIGAADLARGG
ncbi:MAG TPA: ROK family glucokinase [Mycobacteriales bacterium]|nr:ROK family glucokinase [Mycobacteriales bacterium]